MITFSFSILTDAYNYNAAGTAETYDPATDTTAYDLSQMDPEQRAQLEEEWKAELTKVCGAHVQCTLEVLR